ncbi:MAG: GAF domain-containing protein [Ilumatobacteraceae bacterium]
MTISDWRERDDFLDPGERPDLESCVREAVHLMPSVQPVGVAFVTEDEIVVAASANATEVLGRSVIGETVTELLGRSAAALMASARPVPVTIADTDLELRAHRSRTGPVVVEGCMTDRSEIDAAVVIGNVVRHIGAVGGLDELLRSAATSVQEVLGFDRVWVYRFDQEFNERVVAESVIGDLEPFLGLRFEEGDIPAQARALFLENRVRIVRDATRNSITLEPSPLPDGRWLDTSDLTLRGVSPIHLTYLRNMNVTASASLAIVVNGALWGLISGHHYSGPRLLDSNAEYLAGLISDLVSMQVASIEEIGRADIRRAHGHDVAEVLSAVGAGESVLDGLVEREQQLLRIADATGCSARLGGRTRSVGSVPPAPVQNAIFRYLDADCGETARDGPVQIESLGAVVGEAVGHETVAAGVLALLLSRDVGNWIVWYRPEVIETVTYSYRPDLDVEVDGLNPHNSFAKYAATVRGRCTPWGDAAEVASELRSALGAIVFQQTEHLARSAAALRVANLELDRFAYVAAHDLNEPLRGIGNYVDLLREDFGGVLGGDGVM